MALDLFCGAGGASMGLHRAGFDVTGVDIRPQPRYPFRFVQADALKPPFDLAAFDFIWASPPCQASSILQHLPWLRGKDYLQLIPATRTMLEAADRPFVVENVPGAPLRPDLKLCGQMFGLPLYRHRIFEMSFWCLAPGHPRHREVIGRGRRLNDRGKGTLNASSANGSWGKGGVITVAGHQFKKRGGQAALGIDWMTRDEMAQSIPPAYAEFIGRAAMQHIGKAAA
jgi:DNA (cytosine-5)-methyltransferase 1